MSSPLPTEHLKWVQTNQNTSAPLPQLSERPRTWHSFGQWDIGNSLWVSLPSFIPPMDGRLEEKLLLQHLRQQQGWKKPLGVESRGKRSLDHWLHPESPYQPWAVYLQDPLGKSFVTCFAVDWYSSQRKIRVVGYGEHELRLSESVWGYLACQVCQS